jgi:DNA-directed RNA polymerase specialized sigma24 family protein
LRALIFTDASLDRSVADNLLLVPIAAETVWADLSTRPASERPALMHAYLGQLPADEVARLQTLSEIAARRDVLERLAQRARRPQQ